MTADELTDPTADAASQSVLDVRHAGPDTLPRVAAAKIEKAIRDALDRRGRADVALSGGRTPWVAFQALALARLPWDRVHLWQTDERIAPDGDPGRNATGIVSSFGRIGATLHLMPVDPLDPAAYETELHRECGGVLDLVHLGLGPDGHTASWPPGDPVIDVTDHDVAVSGDYQGYRRLTLTTPCVNRARARLFLVTGDDKTEALATLLRGDGAIPACRVTTTATQVVTDLTI